MNRFEEKSCAIKSLSVGLCLVWFCARVFLKKYLKDQCQTGKRHTIFGSTILWCYFGVLHLGLYFSLFLCYHWCLALSGFLIK